MIPPKCSPGVDDVGGFDGPDRGPGLVEDRQDLGGCEDRIEVVCRLPAEDADEVVLRGGCASLRHERERHPLFGEVFHGVPRQVVLEKPAGLQLSLRIRAGGIECSDQLQRGVG